MSQEIQAGAQLSSSKNNTGVNISVSVQLDQSGVDCADNTYSATTSAATVPMGNISGAPKKLLIVHTGYDSSGGTTTNTLSVADDSGITHFVQTLAAGDMILLSPASATVYIKCSASTVQYRRVAVSA